LALDIYSLIIYPIIFIFPAYAANALPVIFSGWGPIDFGKKFGGKRIFGDHKTIRGTLSGLIGGILAGYLEMVIFGLGFMLAASVPITIGALFGDMLGSFIKRRMNLRSGHRAPIMDQYGFFIFALLFALPFLSDFPTWYGLLFIAVLTGILHVVANIVAHRLKLKKVPW
jgi:CDP-2,3-bis-(O-geranylgeranyl)-sn-glycerol synthase